MNNIKGRILLMFLVLYQSIVCHIVIVSSNDTHLDKPAAFGPRLTKQGVLGNLVLAPKESNHGCVPCQSQGKHWVAIVERGGCSFVDKVRSLQASGAIAVIIGDRHYNGWITMYATDTDASDVTIPSVYVAQYQFLSLLQHLQDTQDASVIIRITKNELFTWSLSDLLLFFAVLLPSSVLYALYLTWRVHQQRQQQRRQRRAASHQSKAPAELVYQLKTKAFHKENKDDEEEECIICLETYQEGDTIRKLPCKHEFHSSCVDTWLITRKKYCPICKFDVCKQMYYQPNESTPLLLA
ncbi:hypothetical protein MUCCIDRAFT_157588 [Mucor lusitanicus CBS 277.49]|uniref:RING-type E3 ubiquitin transferase n=1 Tax=Mucor lusitanicus CBS 277.49 TaxID=747725 RepID=A0A168GJH5_MUCCL|nr:hypothetical protein MUCCIDRAFT_157588 [Mucor lusitanicus CBS 277.49]